MEIEQDDIIKHTHQSLLFCPKGEAWRRKNFLFDVTIGAPDGAKDCELVGLYLLYIVVPTQVDDERFAS